MSYQEIDLQDLLLSESNVRALSVEDLEGVDMQELRDSIKEHGIIEPLIVTLSKEGDSYNVIAGRRRLMALNGIYGKKSFAVPCMVVEGKEAVDEWTLSATENKARRNLSPQEWKETIETGKKMGLNQTQIAKRLGVAKSTVSEMASGKTWSEIKKKSTSTHSVPKALEPTEFEPIQCPSCSTLLLPVLDSGTLRLDIPDQDNSAKGSRKK